MALTGGEAYCHVSGTTTNGPGDRQTHSPRRRAVRRAPAGPGSGHPHRFDSFLVELSNAFLQAPADATLSLIDAWLEKLAQLTAIDRVTLWELSSDAETIVCRHSYTRFDLSPPPKVAATRSFAWLMAQNRRGRTIAWSHIPDDIPQAATGEREYGARMEAKSLLSIPVSAGSVVCVLAFTMLRRHRRWPRKLVQQLRLVASILAGAVIRQRAETALRSTEARNRALLQALPDLMLVLSPEGVYIDCHTSAGVELLVPPEKFLGRRVEDILPPEEARVFRGSLAEAARTGGPVESEYCLTIRGERREYEVRMVRRDDGAVVCIVRNISERSRALRLLRESEERFRGAFEHSAIGIALVSVDGRWLRSNDAMCRVLGYSQAELLGLTFQSVTHPDDVAPNLEVFHRALDGEIDHYEMEKRYVHKDGHTIPAFLTVSIVRDEARNPLYFVSQIQDLTERRNAQMEIERQRVELAHFGRLTLAGQLTASFAHQLAQPINAVQFNIAACQRLLAKRSPSRREVHGALEDALASCSRAADTIETLRGILRKEPGPRGKVSVNRLVEQVADAISHYLLLHRVHLTTRLQSRLPEVQGNPIELQQVILNLLVNGAQALQNAVQAREIEVETALREHGVEISVQDSGTVVDPSIVDRMFEPFFTTKAEGMGMGLTICSEILRSHGGRIHAEIGRAGGMIVRCILPASPD
jgi:two-component system, LuxR family, sensor kinase FixL